jgi:signal transduction histidine kinase
MSWLNPWLIRFFAAASVIAGFIFLFWETILPFGIFQISSGGPSSTSTLISLVLSAGQQDEMIFPIRMLKIGWAGIWAAWQYVALGLLFGVIVCWPLSELAGRQSAIKKASEKAKIEYQRYKMDLIEKECRAVGMIRNAYAFKTESHRLKEEVKRVRGELFVMKQSAREQAQNNEDLRQKAASAEKELVKAKAKIRRLTSKSNHQAKNSIDGGQ